MADTSSNSLMGGNFAAALFLIFLVLKLTHVIDWSWWWVTAPLWVSTGLGILILVGVGMFVLIKGAIK